MDGVCTFLGGGASDGVLWMRGERGGDGDIWIGDWDEGRWISGLRLRSGEC